MNGERVTKSGRTILTVDLLASTFDMEVDEDATELGGENHYLEAYEVTRAYIDVIGNVCLAWDATYEKDEG